MLAEVTPGFRAGIKEPVSPSQELTGLNGEIYRLVREQQRERNASGKRRGDNIPRRIQKLTGRLNTLVTQAHLKSNGEKVKAVESPVLQDTASRLVAGEFDTAIGLTRSAHGLQPTDPFPLIVLAHLLKEQFAHDFQASLSRKTPKGRRHERQRRERIQSQAGGAKQLRVF